MIRLPVAIILLAAAVPAWPAVPGGTSGATEAGAEPDPREVREQIAALSAEGAVTRRAAVQKLAGWETPEATTALFGALKSNVAAGRGYESEAQCIEAPGGVRAFVRVASENEALAAALARHEALEAGPLVARALAFEMARPVEQRSPTATTALASALYALTGDAANCWNGERAIAYQPTDLQQEQVRMRFRPDRHPVAGLTLELDLPITFEPKRPGFDIGLLGSKPLEITLRLKNHTDKPIAVDLSRESFSLSCVAGTTRRALPMNRLGEPAVRGADEGEKVPPNGTVELRWRVERLAASPLADLFGDAYLYVHAVYAPANAAVRAAWGETPVQSNTLHRYCIRGE